MSGERRRAQALVEFALVLPLLMFVLLAFAELGFLFAAQHQAQTSADVMADIAAERDLPQSTIAEETAHCDAAVTSVTYPDGGQEPGDRVRVDLDCRYAPRITKGLWDGLLISVQGEAVFRSTASPSPSAAP